MNLKRNFLIILGFCFAETLFVEVEAAAVQSGVACNDDLLARTQAALAANAETASNSVAVCNLSNGQVVVQDSSAQMRSTTIPFSSVQSTNAQCVDTIPGGPGLNDCSESIPGGPGLND